MNNDKKFEYRYTASSEDEKQEAESIRSKYLPPKEKSKVERLRELDGKVNTTPIVVSLTLGVIGTLIFGLGMACVLEWGETVLGCVLGFVGCIPVVAAYFAYKLILKKNKQKYGEEIIRLSNEIISESRDEE